MTARPRQTMTKLFRDHVAKLELAADGRLFSGIRGVELPAITCRRTRVKARQVARTAAEQDHRSPGVHVTAEPHRAARSKALLVVAFPQVRDT